MINITINQKGYSVKEGSTIIDAARANGIDIPALGYDPRVSPPSSVEAAFVEVVSGDKSRFVSATSSLVEPGMSVLTESEALTNYRKIYLQAILRNHYGDCEAPCVLRCPANIDIQKYIYHVKCGNFAEALEVIKENNPLPAVCGRVCPHPCETECRRNALDGAVNINAIKRFVADWDAAQPTKYKPVCAPDTGKKVAVIGAGPAGLSAAWFLRRAGHKVTIFEMQEAAGGMLRYGIPYYRLPANDLDAEIKTITDLGVEIKYNKKLGKDFTLDSLKKDGFDAVFAGLGAQKASSMGIKGEDQKGVMSGLEFLAKLARNEKPVIGDKVIVLGGGNTAMDAARSAVRLGAKEVTIVYRRGKSEMPAEKIEVEEAIEEGVIMQLLSNPVSIQKSGDIFDVTCVKMVLGEPDASGRRSPVPQPGSEFVLKATTVIAAIGQAVDGECMGDAKLLNKKGNIIADSETQQTSIPWVFSGGDCVTGPDIAISAIGAGRKAAINIDKFLKTGSVSDKVKPYTCTKGNWKNLPAETFDGVEKAERNDLIALPSEKRKTNFEESSVTWDEKTAMCEAERCLECGCTERYDCQLRSYASQYEVQHDTAHPATPLPIDDNHPIITRDSGKCILCGLCLKVCREMVGVSALSIYETNNVLSIGPNDLKPLDMTTCVSCGHCTTVCPTGALTLKTPLPDVYHALRDPKKTVVAQIAPAVRATFAEYFGLESEQAMPVLSAGLKKLGFNYVFDTCWAADLTIMEEGTEFLTRVAKGGTLPQITSCCPAWINYSEKMAPDILPHLSTCKSPQQMFGAVMKQYFAKHLNVGPESLYMVSIMPCNAKKYESSRSEFQTCGEQDVDKVLTTNDIIDLFAEKKVDPCTIKPMPIDDFFGTESGSGVIFGATGGVAEAALRLAAERVTGKRLESIDYAAVRGLTGVKEATVTLGDIKVRLAVVSGLANAQKLIDKIRAGEAPYDLIEVMACPGGCINGSGNPAPQIHGDTQERLEVLYRHDKDAKIRKSQDNPAIQEIYANWLGEPLSKMSHHSLHTSYNRRSMRVKDEAPVTPKVEHHEIGVCIGTHCYLKGSWKMLEGIATELRKRGLSDQLRVKACFCTGECKDGPNIVADGKIISIKDVNDPVSIVEKILLPMLN